MTQPGGQSPATPPSVAPTAHTASGRQAMAAAQASIMERLCCVCTRVCVQACVCTCMYALRGGRGHVAQSSTILPGQGVTLDHPLTLLHPPTRAVFILTPLRRKPKLSEAQGARGSQLQAAEVGLEPRSVSLKSTLSTASPVWPDSTAQAWCCPAGCWLCLFRRGEG